MAIAPRGPSVSDGGYLSIIHGNPVKIVKFFLVINY